MDKLKQWVVLTVFGCLAVLVAGWFLFISPKQAEATDLTAQTAAQLQTNDGLRTQLQVLQAQAEDLPSKQADLARVSTKIPDNPALPSLVRALTSAATSAGVELVSVTPGVPVPVDAPLGTAPVAPAAAQTAPVPAAAAPAGPPAPGTVPAVPGAPVAAAPAGALASIPLAINVIGGYFEVAQFMADLESLPRALRVTNLTLAPGASPTATGTGSAASDGRTLTTTITGSVYLAANRPPAAAVVAPAG